MKPRLVTAAVWSVAVAGCGAPLSKAPADAGDPRDAAQALDGGEPDGGEPSDIGAVLEPTGGLRIDNARRVHVSGCASTSAAWVDLDYYLVESSTPTHVHASYRWDDREEGPRLLPTARYAWQRDGPLSHVVRSRRFCRPDGTPGPVVRVAKSGLVGAPVLEARRFEGGVTVVMRCVESAPDDFEFALPFQEPAVAAVRGFGCWPRSCATSNAATELFSVVEPAQRGSVCPWVVDPPGPLHEFHTLGGLHPSGALQLGSVERTRGSGFGHRETRVVVRRLARAGGRPDLIYELPHALVEFDSFAFVPYQDAVLYGFVETSSGVPARSIRVIRPDATGVFVDAPLSTWPHGARIGRGTPFSLGPDRLGFRIISAEEGTFVLVTNSRLEPLGRLPDSYETQLYLFLQGRYLRFEVGADDLLRVTEPQLRAL